MNAFKKTRLAPTPSGFLHLGNVFSFALTAALAEKTGAEILLRIDDMDRGRASADFMQDIFDTLHFLDIPWTQGPKTPKEFDHLYSQRHRLSFYEAALEHLKNSGLIYACTCSRAQVLNHNAEGHYPGTCRNKGTPLDTKDASWRLNTSEVKTIQVKTSDGKIISSQFPSEMQDFVIRKKDGFPAYQLTSVVDDIYFSADLIVRGNDLWPSTLAQLYISSLLPENSFSETVFCHHSLLLDTAGRKLSKSAGDTSVRYLKANGYTATDIFKLIGEKMDIKAPLTCVADFSQLLSVK